MFSEDISIHVHLLASGHSFLSVAPALIVLPFPWFISPSSPEQISFQRASATPPNIDWALLGVQHCSQTWGPQLCLCPCRGGILGLYTFHFPVWVRGSLTLTSSWDLTQELQPSWSVRVAQLTRTLSNLSHPPSPSPPSTSLFLPNTLLLAWSPRPQTSVTTETGHINWVLNKFQAHFCCCSATQLCLTICDPWTAACQAPLSFTISLSSLKLMSIESIMPYNHLILCCPLLLLPSIFPSIRVFSSELALCIRWPKCWNFSFSISPSNEYSGLISFRKDWFYILAVQATLKSLLQHHSSKASVLQCSAFFMVSHPCMTTGKIHSFV